MDEKIEKENFSIMINGSWPGDEAYRVRPGHGRGAIDVVRKDKYEKLLEEVERLKKLIADS